MNSGFNVDQITRRQERPNQRGQSLVELALAMPVIMLLLVGAVDLGRIYFAYVTITNAAREGARYGAGNPADTSGIVNRTVSEATNSGTTIPSSGVVPTCQTPQGSNETCTAARAGHTVIVTVTISFQLVIGYIFGTKAITLTNFAAMSVLGGT